jgi:predicted PurR-regulated permease PerM
MNKNQISPFIITASIIIIIAGLMNAQTVVLPILLALFISIICTYPIMWLKKRKVPHMLGIIIVMLGMLLIFFVIGGIIGDSLAQFYNDAPKYEESLRKITSDLIKNMNQLKI